MQNYITKAVALIVVFLFKSLFLTTEIKAQNCNSPVALNVTNLSNFHVNLNWTLDSDVTHYRLRYKKSGALNWLTRNNIISNTKFIENLDSSSVYVWKVQAFCDSLGTVSSAWSVIDTFLTTNFPPDCYGTPNGGAFIDNCGNCVGGESNQFPCIPFSPTVSISLGTLECDTVSHITFVTSQDPNEPDMSSAIFSSDGGYFDFTGVSTNDIIGTSTITAGGGYINVNTTLMVDFIITPEKISVKAVDDLTNQIYGSFTIENLAGGILVVTTSGPDNNNVTSGNSQITQLNNLFVNPGQGSLTFTSTINSELKQSILKGRV